MRIATQKGLVGQLSAMLCVSAIVGGCTQSSSPPGARSPAQADRSSAPVVDVESPGENQGAGDEVAVTPAADTSPDGLPALGSPDSSGGQAEPPASSAPRETRQVAKPVVADNAAGVPPVLLSAGHSKLCRVNVGDVIPTIELPQLGGGNATLESLAGQKATVVLFWTDDAWMSSTALGDVARLAGGEGVSLVGIAVGLPADAAKPILDQAKATFPQLLDEQGTGFAQVGENALPRLYVLDDQRRIAWFDIEYSEATRREVRQALAALTGGAQ